MDNEEIYVKALEELVRSYEMDFALMRAWIVSKGLDPEEAPSYTKLFGQTS